MADQLGRGLPVGGADELQRARVEPGTRQRRGDDVIEQGGGRAQRGRAGAEHAGVAGLQQLRCHVDGDIGTGLVVRADHTDRHPPFGKEKAAGQLTDVLLRGREGGRGEQRDLPGHLADPRLVEPEPVQQAAAEPGRLSGGEVGGVGVEDLGGRLAEQRGHPAQRRVDGSGPGRR